VNDLLPLAVSEVLAGERTFAVHHSDASALAATLPDGCASLLWCDIPYHGAIDAAWDNVWPSDADFLAAVAGWCAEWRRILAPNGSLYLFASPAMAWAVEGVVRQSFEVLTNIRWVKPAHSTKAEMFVKADLRAPFPASETILFCEQRGSDSVALNRSGYAAKCDEARGFVFEPLRAYFDGERRRSGLSSAQIQEGMKARTGVRYTFCRHTFSRSQWEMPTPEQYAAAQDLFNAEGAAEGRPYLRADYEALRADYEALRRPFFAVPERPYTDAWTFPTVQAYEGKHPCEKPAEMCEHAVLTSSRPGDLVVDLFGGSGAMGSAALANGRRFLGGDADAHWADHARRRCEMTLATGRTATRSVVVADPRQGRLF